MGIHARPGRFFGCPLPGNAIDWEPTADTDATSSMVVTDLVVGRNERVLAGVGGAGFDPEARGVLRTSDSGNRWEQVNTGLTLTSVASLAVDSSGNLFAGTHGAGVFRSSDDGNNWVRTSLGNKHITSILPTASAVYASDGFVCTGVHRTTDGGATWTPKNEGLHTCVNALGVDSLGRLFAGFDRGDHTAAEGRVRQVTVEVGRIEQMDVADPEAARSSNMLGDLAP